MKGKERKGKERRRGKGEKRRRKEKEGRRDGNNTAVELFIPLNILHPHFKQ